ncbi:hypothetical protein GMDG_03855 [Pseudogymnoascus destructans 20631-21]|uniref:Uncharacterized protein n=1 Tax=Pseudogymnoascus destructans (strain ATCC MYA-4855 / 20631-21) TaxID=658429 RepID=L8G868_PSED2|nr:hypothetical protein GMDG_03855 [Pseudogymnoascus destructans 20631-21]
MSGWAAIKSRSQVHTPTISLHCRLGLWGWWRAGWRVRACLPPPTPCLVTTGRAVQLAVTHTIGAGLETRWGILDVPCGDELGAGEDEEEFPSPLLSQTAI